MTKENKMQTLIIKLVLGQKISTGEICEELFEICDTVHAGCHDECPVYRMNGSSVPNKRNSEEGCDCFKNGHAMFRFIKRAYAKKSKGKR